MTLMNIQLRMTLKTRAPHGDVVVEAEGASQAGMVLVVVKALREARVSQSNQARNLRYSIQTPPLPLSMVIMTAPLVW